MIEKRRKAEASGDPAYKKPEDLLQGMMDLSQSQHDSDPAIIVNRVLGLTGIALGASTTTTLLHVLYDLISMPQWQEPLREGIRQVFPSAADWKSASQTDFLALKRMDSFFKESQRFSPVVAFPRVVLKDITLEDGLKLPKGTRINLPSRSTGMDPSIVEEPEVFNGLRYVDADVGGDNVARTFVTTGPASLYWGTGRYACPGRFFADYMMKAFMSRFLTEYEFKFGPEQMGRPKNMGLGDRIGPNVHVDVYIRRRVT